MVEADKSICLVKFPVGWLVVESVPLFLCGFEDGVDTGEVAAQVWKIFGGKKVFAHEDHHGDCACVDIEATLLDGCFDCVRAPSEHVSVFGAVPNMGPTMVQLVWSSL